MGTHLTQFNSGELVIGNRNVVKSVISEGDIIFNESYVVVGDLLQGKTIHAMYDLTIIGNAHATKMSVNGDLLVKGNLEVEELICHGEFFCTGDVRARELHLEAYAVAGSIVAEKLYAGDKLFLRTTVDTDKEFIAEELVVAGEGIMGDGSFEAEAAIANEYFDFHGVSISKVFEIAEMEFADTNKSNEPKDVLPKACDVNEVASNFARELEQSIQEWNELEENELIAKLRTVTNQIVDLHMVDRIIDKIIDLSYERSINNFCDFLYLLCAKNTFTKGLSEYETIQPVLEDMYGDAIFKIDTMEYHALNIEELAISLLSLYKYADQLPISYDEAADKIFSSIGIKYSTVEHIWRKLNG